ncbi:MAG: DUF481 domain-containing protein [Planctomycetota bacterium]
MKLPVCIWAVILLSAAQIAAQDGSPTPTENVMRLPEPLTIPPVTATGPNGPGLPRANPANEVDPMWTEDFGLSLPNPAPSQATPQPLTDPGAESSSSPTIPTLTDRQAVETPPLQSQVVRWYHYPWKWISEGWDNHAEFGLDGSSGNADTLAIQTGLEMKRTTDAYTLALDIDYRQASANNDITEDNGRLNLDYDRLLGDSAWSAFGKLGLEFDEFKVFDLRLNLNSGVGYYWIRDDQSNLVTRFGAGASKEFGAPDDDWIPEAVFGLEADHQLTKRQKVKAKFDYFPAWNDFADYRLVADLAWETLLDSSDNLSLRIAVTDRYDSTPQGAEANDFYYSVLLLYKF